MALTGQETEQGGLTYQPDTGVKGSDHPERMQKTLFHLSFPLLLNSLLTFAVMLAETMIVSAHSANTAAAVAVAKQILVIAFEVSAMMGIGAVILISHNLGRGNEAQAKQVAVVAIVANSLIGLLLGMVLAFGSPVVIWLLDVPETLAGDARLYLSIVAAAMVFNGFSMAAMSCIRAFGNSRTILQQGIVVALLFVAAEYALVLGIGAVPSMGVAGAALGVLLVRVVMAVLLWIVMAKLVQIRFSPTRIRRQIPLVRQLFSLSFPSVSDYIAYGFYQLILLGFVGGFGVHAVLGRTYAMIVMAFLVLIIVAISQGNEVLMGYRRGEGSPEKAYRQALRSSLMAAGIATLVATSFWMLADQFTALFTGQEEVRTLTHRLLWLTIFIQPGFAINTILFQSLRAMGDVKWPVVASLLVTWGLGLPLAWLLAVRNDLGVEGVWYALIIEETMKAAVMALRWRRRQWHRHDL